MPLHPDARAELIEAIRRKEAQLSRDVEFRRQRTRESFRWFAEAAWPNIEPRAFVDGRHIDVLCDFLQDYYDNGGGEDAVVNIPPGTGKSLICSVLFPCWIWAGRDPGHRTICTSYADTASRRDAIRARNLVQSEWWREAWPDISIPFQNTHAAADWTTTRGGWRISVPLGGQLTGRHGDMLIIDDPIKPEDARIERQALADVHRIIEETLPTRLLNPASAHRLIVMQRLHERDPAGVAIARGARRLVLPMRAEEQRDPLDWREPRELLWPGMLTEPDVAALESRMSAYAIAGQLQQRPVPEGGGMFRREHLRLGRISQNAQTQGAWCISVDAAFKGNDRADYVAIGAVCFYEGKVWPTKVQRERLTFRQTCDALRLFAAEHRHVAAILVEDAANGPAIADALDREVAGIRLVKPLGGKEARAHVASAYWEAGDVVLPPDQPWVAAFVDELCGFPNGEHDDQVDMLSQAVNFLAGHSSERYRRGVHAVREELRAGRRFIRRIG